MHTAVASEPVRAVHDDYIPGLSTLPPDDPEIEVVRSVPSNDDDEVQFVSKRRRQLSNVIFDSPPGYSRPRDPEPRQ